MKQNEFHAFDILLDPSQKRKLNTKVKSRLLLLTSTAGILIAVFLAIFLYLDFLKSDNAEVSDQVMEYKVLGRTLLILPFENNSPNEFDYVAKGITDHLQSTLPSTILLNIVPRGKSEQIKIEKISNENLKTEFDISYVLSGRVSVVKERFRLSLELLDIHTNEILFSSNSEFQLADLFSAQDKIEFSLIKQIQTKLTMGSVLSAKYEDHFVDRTTFNKILALRVEENAVSGQKLP